MVVTVEYREYNSTMDLTQEQRFSLPMVPSDPLELLRQIDLSGTQTGNNNQLLILADGLVEVSPDSLLVLNENQEYLYHQEKLYTRREYDCCVYDTPAPMPSLSWWMNQFKVFAIPSSSLKSADSNINIEVKTMTGKSIPIQLPIYSTVSFLKEVIQDCEGILPDQQKLHACGNQMEDHDRLIDHHIQNGSIIHLILRLRGGMYLPPSARDGWEHLLPHNPAPAQPICIKVSIECPYQPGGVFQLQLTLPQGQMHSSDLKTEVSCGVAEYRELMRLGFGEIETEL